jgi:hypothetical protein
MYARSMIPKELVAASAEALILSLLSKGESYGYAIIQEVRARSNDHLKWTDGMLYPVLHRMEKKNMPDLDEKIAAWRRQMLTAGIKTPVPLEELESHLREDIEQQIRSGLGVQQAFETAIQRLGQASALKMEFKKVGATERTQMKRIVAILTALFGMVFGLSTVLPQLGQWSRTGVMHSPAFLLLGVALITVGGSAAFYGIKTHREARGRKLISIGIIAACGFYAMPLILAFVQPRETNLMGWVFCAVLTATSLFFFGSCFYFNRHLPTRSVPET